MFAKYFKMLADNNIFYVLVRANCTDRLQPLDLSINKPAKDFMKKKFQEWYANIILQQLESGITEYESFCHETFGIQVGYRDACSSKPYILINGFQKAGIIDALKNN